VVVELSEDGAGEFLTAIGAEDVHVAAAIVLAVHARHFEPTRIGKKIECPFWIIKSRATSRAKADVIIQACPEVRDEVLQAEEELLRELDSRNINVAQFEPLTQGCRVTKNSMLKEKGKPLNKGKGKAKA
jgi:hypothetical protein